MKRTLRLPILFLLLVALLLTSDPLAKANDIPSGTQVVLIFVAVGVIGAAIGVGVYYAVRKSPAITGCVVSTSTGLTLRNENDQKAFALIGDTAALKPGDRVRVKGRKKKDATGGSSFLVDKLTGDYGTCKAVPATP